MKPKPFARASAHGGPTKAALVLAQSYQRLFSGNGTQEDAEVVMTDLADTFGYYRRPTYREWLAKRNSADGFELHSALCNARAEVIQHILDLVMLSDTRMVELEKAARLERIAG
jgi:hypothetical protein